MNIAARNGITNAKKLKAPVLGQVDTLRGCANECFEVQLTGVVAAPSQPSRIGGSNARLATELARYAKGSGAVGTYTHVLDQWGVVDDQPIVLNK